MVMAKASPSSETGKLPSQDLLLAMGKFNEELVNNGIMEFGEGLKPTSEGVRVRFSGNNRSVTRGPFVETNKLLAGYWVWDAASMEEAIEWVKKCPNPMEEDSGIEIRPFYEMDDFAEVDPTGEARQQEDALRNTLALQKSTINNYLFFSGHCEEALNFYQQHLGAKITMLLRFNESPDPVPGGMFQTGFKEKIMRAEFTVGGMTLMASDGCDEKSRFDGFRLALTVPKQDDAERVFNALADGRQVDMPLGPTFWSPLFGQVSDRFGLGWMVMLPETAQH